ncbi:MAG: histidine--tRNA ligase [Leptospirales bacterium]
MKDKISTKPYRGSRDFYPDEMRFRSWVFEKLSTVVESFGFEKIDAPLIEPIEIYLAKTSEEIVSQQIYSFTDRGGRNVAIRPEMTPTVARMVAGKIMELPKPIRWYSIPNLWRYERPGRGRLREHWQLNADIFGAKNEEHVDIEIVQLAIELLKSFGADETQFKLYLNHRQILNDVFENIIALKPEIWANVSRIMDKKEKISEQEYTEFLTEQGLNETQISILNEYMNSGLDFITKNSEKIGPSGEAFLNVISALEKLGYQKYIEYNPGVVRGFDYYTGLVFEVFDSHPDNARSLFGGGRYDNLVGTFSKQSINAVGFGMGDVTFAEFLKLHNLIPETNRKTQIYFASFAEKELRIESLKLAMDLRNKGYFVENCSGDKKLTRQFEEANAKSIPVVLLQGEQEVQDKTIAIKNMSTGEQTTVPIETLENELEKIF